MVSDESFDTYWSLLKKHKFIEDVGGTKFNLSSTFIPILESNMTNAPTLLEAITWSVVGFEPTLSTLEKAIVSDFLVQYMSDSSPSLKKILQKEVEDERRRVPNLSLPKEYQHLTSFDSVLKEIRDMDDSK